MFEVFFVWENFVLYWQVYFGVVYQINNWQVVFYGDFLSLQVFFVGNWKLGISFNCGIISDNYVLLFVYIVYVYDYFVCWVIVVFFVYFVFGESVDFQKVVVFVDELFNMFLGGYFVFFVQFFNFLFFVVFVDFFQVVLYMGEQQFYCVFVFVFFNVDFGYIWLVVFFINLVERCSSIFWSSFCRCFLV